MDGARIHCHPIDIIMSYHLSLRKMPIFLPACCPFHNPIEVPLGCSSGGFVILAKSVPLPISLHSSTITSWLNYATVHWRMCSRCVDPTAIVEEQC